LHEGIFYRTNRFARVEQGVFWLSLSPDTPGSTYTGTTTPRIAVWARLLDRVSGHTYFALCTHWDPQSAAEREYAAALIRTRIAALAPAVPVVLLGDLNCNESSRAYKILAGREDPGGRQFTDTYRACVPVQQSTELTRHNFAGGTTGSRIDFIFASGDFAVSQAAINRTAYGGRYPSDHYPVDAAAAVSTVRPVIVSVGFHGDACRLSWTAASGLVYRVESSASIRPWATLDAEAVTVIAPDSLGTADLPILADRHSRYCRVAFVPSE
jgi:endonuclease/exonuclease/phosphatase family metal-dependent hydrolase